MRSTTHFACTAAVLSLATYAAADSLQWVAPVSTVANLTIGQDIELRYLVNFGGAGELQRAAFSFYEIDEHPVKYNVSRRSILPTVKRSSKHGNGTTTETSKNKAKASGSADAAAGSIKKSYNDTEVWARPIALDFNMLTRNQWFAQNTTAKGGMASFTAVSVGRLLVVLSGVEVWPCTDAGAHGPDNATSEEKVQMSNVSASNTTECAAVLEISRIFSIVPAKNATQGTAALASSPPHSKAASANASATPKKSKSKNRPHTSHGSAKTAKPSETPVAAAAAFAASKAPQKTALKTNLLAQRDLIAEQHVKRNGSASFYLSQHPLEAASESHVKRNGSVSQYLAQHHPAGRMTRKMKRSGF